MEDLFADVRVQDAAGIWNYRNLVNGCWDCLSSGSYFEVRNPATGELVGRVPNASAQDVRQAITAAKAALKMMNFTPLERLEIMARARGLLLERADFLAETITRESGKPIALARGEVDATAERLHLAQEETRVLYGEYIPGEWVTDTQNKFAIVLRKPLGVVVTISPFNYPLYIASAKIIPALLAGNAVVAKPASDTPLSLILFVRILEKAGLPPGTINVITGRGQDIGDILVQSPDVDAISFTGSTPVGEAIAAKVGVKKLHLELGGKAAAIVLADANLDLAARQICSGVFRNSGQRCDAVSRVLVQRDIHELFLEKVLAEARGYATGDPLNPATALGTVIDRAAVDRIQGLVDDAVGRGARLLLGGRAEGLFYPATILDGVTPDMRIAWEEIFGPVMPILTVDRPEEAVRLSNASEFGLDSCMFTQNLELALTIARQLQDGSVTINGVPVHGVGHFPFGGNKKSGLGREGLKYSIDELTKLHTIILTQG